MSGRCLALLMTVSTTAAWAQTSAPIREFSTATTEALGLEIFRHDYASARASDLLTTGDFDPAEHGVRGYIASEDEQGLLVSFIGIAEGEFVAVFDVRPNASAEDAVRHTRDRRLSEDELTRFLARMTALRALGDTCSSSYNTVVLADPVADGWLVYLLSASTRREQIPVNGHYRMSVSANATRLVQIDKLFGDCEPVRLDLEAIAAGTAPAEIEIERDLGAGPFETDVFLALVFGIDLKLTWPSGHEARVRYDGTIGAAVSNPVLL